MRVFSGAKSFSASQVANRSLGTFHPICLDDPLVMLHMSQCSDAKVVVVDPDTGAVTKMADRRAGISTKEYHFLVLAPAGSDHSTQAV